MKVRLVWNSWNCNNAPVFETTVVEEVRSWVSNHVDRHSIYPEHSDMGQCVVLELSELQANVMGAVVGAFRVAHGIEPIVTIEMSLQEIQELERKQHRQRSSLEIGIRMLYATKSWFLGRRLAEIRNQLEAGLK